MPKYFRDFIRGKETLVVMGFLFLVAVGMCWPLFRNDFPTTHDFINSLTKHLAMRDFFGKGQFLPVWVPDYYYGYGGAVFNFYPPLFPFLSACLGWLGIPSALAINLASFAVILLSAWAMFLFLQDMVGRAGAVLGATAYAMAPYHMVDLYVRGAHSELAAFVFLPLILWGVLKQINDPGWRYFYITAGSSAGLILSHGVTAIFFLPMVMFLGILLAMKRKGVAIGQRISPFAAIFVGILLVAFFVLPAFLEKQYLDQDRFWSGYFDYRQNFIHFLNLLFSADQLAFLKIKLTIPPLPLQLGFVYISGALFGLICALLYFPRKIKALVVLFLVFFVISIWMMTASSKVAWERFPALWSLQFPWRFSVSAVFFLCSFIACLGAIPDQKRRWGVCILGIICILFTRMADFKAPVWNHWPASGISRELRTIRLGYLPLDFKPVWAKRELSVPAGRVLDFPQGEAEIIAHHQRSPVAHTFQVSARTNVLACFYNYYFPGWKVLANGRPLDLMENDYGLILFVLPPGSHQVDIFFASTPIRIIGGAISLLTAVFLAIIAFRRKVFFGHQRRGGGRDE